MPGRWPVRSNVGWSSWQAIHHRCRSSPCRFRVLSDEEPGAELAVPGLDNRDDECRQLEAIRALAIRAQAAESKVCALIRLLHRAHEPAIVFTEYRDTLARLASLLDEMKPVTLHGGLTPAERGESLRRFTSGKRAFSCHRCGQRRAQPSPALPAGDQSRAAVDASSPRTADRPRGAYRTGETCSRGAPFRRRYCRGDARYQAGDTHGSGGRSDREATRSTVALTHIRGIAESETRRIEAIAPALGTSRQGRLWRKTSV